MGYRRTVKNDFLELSKTLMCKVEDILANFGGVAWHDAYIVDRYFGTSYYFSQELGMVGDITDLSTPSCWHLSRHVWH